MQLIVDPESSISIEPKMAALSSETLNGITTNGSVDELDKAIANDNKENVISNEDSSTSNKDEINNTSELSFGINQSTKENDVKEKLENITNNEIENGDISTKGEDVLENKQADIYIETDKQNEESPHIDELVPILTDAQNSNANLEDSKKEEILESSSLSVAQSIQGNDITINNDVSVEDINSKSNVVNELSEIQDETLEKSKETVDSLKNRTKDTEIFEEGDTQDYLYKTGKGDEPVALATTDLISEVKENNTEFPLENKADTSDTTKELENKADTSETIKDFENKDDKSETIIEQSATLKEQSETINEQSETIKEQSETIKTSSETLKEQSETIKEQSETIKEQSETIKTSSETLKEQSETIKEQPETIKEQSETIKQQSETMANDPSAIKEDGETLAEVKSTDIQPEIADNTVIRDDENGDLPFSTEEVHLELDNTLDKLTKETEETNNISEIIKAEGKLSEENVGEVLPKAEGSKEESNLDNTREVSESKNDLNLNGTNLEPQISDNESVISKMEIEENMNDKTGDNTVTSVESKNLETSNIILESKIDHDNKDHDDCNKSQKIEVDNEQNEIGSGKDKEVETLAVVEPNDNNLNSNSKLIQTLTKTPSCMKLSNTMNILSDEEEDDDKSRQDAPKPLSPLSENRCINLVEDDDCMLIDEDTSEQKTEKVDEKQLEKPTLTNESNSEKSEENSTKVPEEADISIAKGDPAKEAALNEEKLAPTISEKEQEKIVENKKEKPLIPKTFLQNCKRKLSDMTRDDLEEFCVLKIAEAIIDRANLSDIKSKLTVMNKDIEEYKKKALILTRQNRDLQVVLKSVQEEQKKKTNAPITPLKITRSVGMQVVMIDKPVRRKLVPVAQAPINNTPPSPSPTKILRSNVSINNQRPSASSTTPIPVPRLVPAQSMSKPVAIQSSPKPIVNTITNGAKKSPSIQQKPEKRPLSRQQTTSQSDTVDLTDDEPPAKANRTASSNMPVRLVQQQSLMAPRVPNMPQTNNHRKVYIPISSSHTEGLKVGQKIMLRGVRPPDPVVMAPQIRAPPPTKVMRLPNAPPRLPRPNMTLRHPAPLPETHKQYQPPNWKSVPPAPDLKLSKVENGIVISWKIDGYMEDKFEEIASYQLYAYQETSAAPSTMLWKKIGDVKALPLPMACTLTQFMAGYKYYFAVRAVDVKSRVGPFSMPGSILLLNKV